MDRRGLNTLINQLDPPKDLAVTTSWTPPQKIQIKRIIEDMFGPITNPAWKPLGNHTAVISDELRRSESTKRMYENPVKIVRLKYVTGHSATPKNLFLVQDNGPIDIIDEPIILITGGAVIDAAGKTKTPSTNGTYTIKNLIKEGIYNRLPGARFIEQLAMEGVLNGDVVMEYNRVSDQYTITIPTTLDPIIETFNANFQPISGKPTPSYFAGNPQKNVAIQKALDKSPPDLVTAKKYVLSKEVSDTFQVAWMDVILTDQAELPVSASASSSSSPPEPRFVRANTVVGSTDKVVLYRCVVYNVGCIHTDTLGVSRQFIPQGSSPAEQELIRRQQIETIGKELLIHNQSVIKLLADVAKSTKGDTEWIEQVSWGADTRGKAKTYLQKKLRELISFNEDLTRKVEQLHESATEANLTEIKELKNSERFRAPFVQFKGYYKKMLTVRSILPNGRIPFVVSRFTTTARFNSMEGGRRVQKGGENTERLERILRKNIKEDSKTILMFLCFINEYMPELITYAKCMNTAMNMIDPRRLAKDIVPKKTQRVLRTPDIRYEILKQQLNYVWDEEETFVLLDDVDKLFTAEEYKEIKKVILHVIVYSNLFTDLFQDTYDDKHSALNNKFNDFLVDPDSLRDDGMDIVSSIAITLYENEYRMEIMSTHGDLSPEARAEEIRRIVNEIAECGRENPEREEYSLLYNYYSRMLPPSAAAPSASAASASSSSSSSAAALPPGSPPRLPFLEPEPATLQKKRSARTNNVNDGSGRRISPKLELFNKAPVNGSQRRANSQIHTQALDVTEGVSSLPAAPNNMDGGKRRTHKKRKQKKRTTRRR